MVHRKHGGTVSRRRYHRDPKEAVEQSASACRGDCLRDGHFLVAVTWSKGFNRESPAAGVTCPGASPVSVTCCFMRA